ncbi:hypothetical protein HA052_04455 [Chromobacterium haemolyticum]|uniref:Uncharacterized protein n=1 Tax=Chromobacterium fluminis TaxID=3044269 RepID=A0ABX0LAP5_9NEIS|nr:hypothetical protein [Chromobacterium haemolyticum]NHR04442.1 hypothetical protein [Chromobacterium haemolyticum]
MTGVQREARFDQRSREEIEAEKARMSPVLTAKDHDDLDVFLHDVLDDFSKGVLSRDQVVQGLSHMIAAASLGNYVELRNNFKHGLRPLGEEAEG